MFSQNKNSVGQHTSFSRIYAATRRHTHDLSSQGCFTRVCEKVCSFKQESLELGFEFRQSGKIWQTGRQRFPDRWIDETERALTNRFQITFRNFQKLLA